MADFLLSHNRTSRFEGGYQCDPDDKLHAINGLCHLAICIYFGIAIHWTIGLAMLFYGRVFFDTALNVFRMGWRNIGYVPRYPKSITDKLEKKVFGKNGILPKVLYIAIAIILNLITFLS